MTTKKWAVQPAAYRWFAAGLFVVIVALAFLEIRCPYYFCQDDNFAYELGPTIYGCNAFFHGTFPTYNPYQYLGSPLNTIGEYMFTYPVLYVSYAAARWILHDPNTVIDVYCWIHLTVGFCTSWIFFRALRLRPQIAVLASLAFVLSGFSLIVGRSWVFSTALVTYLPLIFTLLITLRRNRANFRWVLLAGVIVGLFLVSGFVQLWIYGMFFALIWLLLELAEKKVDPRNVPGVLSATLLGFALATPMIASFFQTTEGWERVVQEGPRLLLVNLINVFLPINLKPIAVPGNEAGLIWGSFYYRNMNEVFSTGSVMPLFGFLALLLLVSRRIKHRPSGRSSEVIWILLSALALAFCFGGQLYLWTLLHSLPLLSKMKDPFKFFPFFNFFAITAGAIFAERMARLLPSRKYLPALTAVSALLLIIHLAQCNAAFYIFGNRTAPGLTNSLASVLKPNSTTFRTYSVGQIRTIRPNLMYSLVNTWPTYYHVMALRGYDPFVLVTPQTAHALDYFNQHFPASLKTYGIGLVILDDPKRPEVYSANRMVTFERQDSQRDLTYAYCHRNLKQVYSDGTTLIFEVPGIDPMAFEASSKYPLPLTVTPTGFEVNRIPGNINGPVILNFVYRPHMQALADGIEAPIHADPAGRIMVLMPRGTHTLRVLYPMPWRMAICWSCVLIALSLLILAVGGYFKQQAADL